MHFGSTLEHELEKAVENGKRKKPMSDAQRHARTQEVLARWLGAEAVKKKFRDPAAQFKERT